MTIMVLGLSCSGKSTFSTKLGELLDLKVIHLDHYYWKTPWIINDNFNINDFIQKDNCIIDGNYFSHSFTDRLSHCDLIIYINCNVFYRIFRMIRRHIFYCICPKNKNAISQKINIQFVFLTIKKQLFWQPKIIRYLKKNCSNKFIYIKNIKNIQIGNQNA